MIAVGRTMPPRIGPQNCTFGEGGRSSGPRRDGRQREDTLRRVPRFGSRISRELPAQHREHIPTLVRRACRNNLLRGPRSPPARRRPCGRDVNDDDVARPAATTLTRDLSMATLYVEFGIEADRSPVLLRHRDNVGVLAF
jgi:hypothetical protein